MASQTSIEWTATVHQDGTVTPGATWNPVRGCSRVSEGCVNCYAEIMAARFSGVGQWGEGFAHIVGGDHRWTGKVELVAQQLRLPLTWKAGRRIFVNSTSDMFHEKLTDEDIGRVFAVMALCPQHTFQILTKRAARMAETMTSILSEPLPNVWLGVSVEDQETADERIPHLLATPAAVRFISAEPLLRNIRLHEVIGDDWLASGKSGERKGLDWVIVGGESGPGSRPMHAGWVRSIMKQCQLASVPIFVKQMGRKIVERNDAGFDGSDERSWDVDPMDIGHDIHGYREEYQGADCLLTLNDKKGANMEEWPRDFRVRQFPSAAAP